MKRIGNLNGNHRSKINPPGNLLNIENDAYSVYFGMMIDHESCSTSN